MASRVIIFGGAGFLGSHIADRFCAARWDVTVVDGLLPDTGGTASHLNHLAGKVRMLSQRIEELPELPSMVAATDVVVDAMAWTSHLSALERPEYDLELNSASHLPLIAALRKATTCRTIYLGSRGQYGNPTVPSITEDTPMIPVDVQGINKVAAESYYRVFSKLHGLPCISLRIPNCFGERQPCSGPDLGLVGGFIRDALNGKDIEVFGQERKRNVIYAGDLADIVLRLAEKPFTGFQALNVAGRHLTIHELASMIVTLAKSGRCVVRPIPPEIRAIDASSAGLDDHRLRKLIGPLPETEFRIALLGAIDFLKKHQETNTS